MNREMPAPELLRSAAKLVERALIQLDMRHDACGECGTRLFVDREHAAAYQRLTDLPQRLQEVATRLEDVPGGFVPITETRNNHTRS